MPRTLSGAAATEAAKTVTAPGYLVDISLAAVRRWSNVGQFTVAGNVYKDVDFAIEGLSFDNEGQLTGTFRAQNLDVPSGESVRIGDLLRDSAVRLADLTFTVYQFFTGALSSGDAVQLAIMSPTGLEIVPDEVRISLAETANSARFAPRKFVNLNNGFKYATNIGKVITWQNEIFTAGAPVG